MCEIWTIDYKGRDAGFGIAFTSESAARYWIENAGTDHGYTPMRRSVFTLADASALWPVKERETP